MPPRPKFTREEIIAAALDLVSEKGLQALTSRDLGARLGSSARPIFTVFKNMEEVQREVCGAAMGRFEEFPEEPVPDAPAFKQFGMQMIRFAIEEPKLYQLLFMSENGAARSFDDIFATLGDNARVCVDVIQRDYGLTEDEAGMLFRQVWIYTFGIGALCAARVCRFSGEEIDELMRQNFTAMMMLIKSGKSGQ